MLYNWAFHSRLVCDSTNFWRSFSVNEFYFYSFHTSLYAIEALAMPFNERVNEIQFGGSDFEF